MSLLVKAANPGETVTLEFKAPAGNYEFFCSYPGHSGKMRVISLLNN